MPPPRLAFRASRALHSPKTLPGIFFSLSCSRCQALLAPNGASQPHLIEAQHVQGARRQMTDASQTSIERPPAPLTTSDRKSNLKSALIDLQKHSSTYVNISRLGLALRGLEQNTGEETIRVAILGLSDQRLTSKKVRDLVRLLLADPLKEEEEWERILVAAQDAGRPLLLRIGQNAHEEASNYGLSNRLVQEINISSPNLNRSRLEILVLESDILAEAVGQVDISGIVLVPTFEIPTSSTGRYTPVTTPVHKALILGDGLLGAASLVNFSGELDSQIILPVVDLPAYPKDPNVPIHITDIGLANSALDLFRKSVDNAMTYERGWFESGLPDILAWLKDGTLDDPGRRMMKNPVRHLIHSVLDDASNRIQAEEARQLSSLLASKIESSVLKSLKEDLSNWSQSAHTELRDQLDIAFRGTRWRKLGWWKLFWRVDDVSMISSDILNQRFLTSAEREIIYLAGKIEQAGVFKAFPVTNETSWAYKSVPTPPSSQSLGSTPGPLYLEDLLDTPKDDVEVVVKDRPWPLAIPRHSSGSSGTCTEASAANHNDFWLCVSVRRAYLRVYILCNTLRGRCRRSPGYCLESGANAE
jgi:hypothetical protein